MKSFNMPLTSLALLSIFLLTTLATVLPKPAQTLTSTALAPVPTVAFGGPTTEMTDCLKKTECQFASRLWDYCTACLPGAKTNNYMLNPRKNNTATYECLCSTYYDLWASSLKTCIPCLAASLAAKIDDTTPTRVNPSNLLSEMILNIDSYCLNTHSKATGLQSLIGAGMGITNRYHSPILIFNVTVATGPVSDFGFGPF